MTGMNTAFVFGFILLILILLILLVSVLLKNNKSTVKAQNREKFVSNISLPNISSVLLPPKIENLSLSELENITYKIFELYRYFDFKNMSEENLEKKEWHSWQVSMLIMLYKKNGSFHIIEQDKIFGDFLINSDENRIKSLMKSIINKYVNFVSINDIKDNLSKDYIWTNKDVSIIFYFLNNYKNYNK